MQQRAAILEELEGVAPEDRREAVDQLNAQREADYLRADQESDRVAVFNRAVGRAAIDPFDAAQNNTGDRTIDRMRDLATFHRAYEDAAGNKVNLKQLQRERLAKAHAEADDWNKKTAAEQLNTIKIAELHSTRYDIARAQVEGLNAQRTEEGKPPISSSYGVMEETTPQEVSSAFAKGHLPRSVVGAADVTRGEGGMQVVLHGEVPARDGLFISDGYGGLSLGIRVKELPPYDPAKQAEDPSSFAVESFPVPWNPSSETQQLSAEAWDAVLGPMQQEVQRLDALHHPELQPPTGEA